MNALAHVKREHGEKLKEWEKKLEATEDEKKCAIERLSTKHRSEMQDELRTAKEEKRKAMDDMETKHSQLISVLEEKVERLTLEKDEALKEQENRLSAIILRLGTDKTAPNLRRDLRRLRRQQKQE